MEATIESVKPSVVSRQGKLAIELRLRNTGSTTYYLPASMDQWKTIRPGHKGRRQTYFQLRLLREGQPEEITSGLAVCYGSESVPSSFLKLPTQGTVLVLLEGDLAVVQELYTVGKASIGVQVMYEEYTLEDDRYFVKALSNKVRSSNVIEISLQP